MYKFILAGIAYFLFDWGVGGALIGFLIGSGIDNSQRIRQQFRAQAAGRQNRREFSAEDLFNYYQQRASTNDVPTMLMALSAAVMKADGKVLKSELNYVKSFFAQQFGPQFNSQHLQTLKQFLGSEIPMNRICQDIRMRMQPEVRVQLLHYMFGIAKADGEVSAREIEAILRISQLMGVASSDFESVKNMFYRNVDSDYKVLGIESTASDDEVKKAYRKMAIKFHPDKVAQMGEAYQKGAKEKFQKIQEAYETIKKRRGMK